MLGGARGVRWTPPTLDLFREESKGHEAFAWVSYGEPLAERFSTEECEKINEQRSNRSASFQRFDLEG